MTMIANSSSWTVAPEPVGSAGSAALLREYLVDVADRWYLLHHGRRCTPEEIERHLAEDPSDDLVPPQGVFLVGRYDGGPAGCVGVRRLDARTAEVKRMFVRPAQRGRGGGPVLLGAAEESARSWGAERLVLDTRLDLVEARALYARQGFRETPAHNDGAYAEVWMTKRLEGVHGRAS